MLSNRGPNMQDAIVLYPYAEVNICVLSVQTLETVI